MSTVAYWLQRQRKADLQNLAAHVGMINYDTLLKTELEVALDEFLRTNQISLQNDPQLSGFYKRINSPVKRESGGGTATSLVEEVKKPKQRRQTLKAREDLDQPTLYTRSPIPSTLYSLRSRLSSVTSIQLFILAIEAIGLFSRVVPLKYLTTIPPIPALGIHRETALRLPDLFALLTSDFWGPVGLWVGTSILVPACGAWFLNLRAAMGEENGDGYDPVAFGVVKGLVGWIVY
ncbi:MAG: hypothetical protein LQ338_003536, partial [Usnochroma carphineum]